MTSKTTRIVAILIALCLVLSLALTACTPKEHTCVDNDGDGKCDECDKVMEHKHVDSNNDGKCDECNENMEHRHVDLNSDDKCDICGGNMPKPASPVEISVSAEKDKIALDETMNVTVTVENTTDKTYTWSYSKQGIVKVENDVLSVVKTDLRLDTFVTITATSNADKNATASFSVTVLAPKIEGQVGELTSEMLTELGNASITTTGTVADYYIDHNNPSKNWQNYYDFTVKMMDGAWEGTWNPKGSDTVLTNQYRKGTTEVRGENGEYGYALEECFVSKDNEAVSKVVKNYMSIPTLWSSQHLWNHLGSLNINYFHYDAENEVYSYDYNHSDAEEIYLMTYLAFSLTPMLGNSDTFDKLYLTIEDGKITKLQARTFVEVYPTDAEDPDATAFTEVTLTFSDIGETVVENVATYEADENNAVLQNALTKMAQTKNYLFNAVDTTIYAPMGDSSDYEMSAKSTATKARALPNGSSSKGQIGLQGWVTENEILLRKTGKYSYGMDDNLYFYEYYGYKQVSATQYDYFTYSSTQKAYVGQTKYNGNISDRLPKFDFSANLFKCVGLSMINNVTTYTYELKTYSVCRDIAMQLGMYYADNCVQLSDSNAKFVIVANENQIVSVKYPYELSSGQTGYITITFSEVGTAEMIKDARYDEYGILIPGSEKDVFEGYIERVIPTSWAQTETKYYNPQPGTNASETVSSDVAFQDAFGDKFTADTFPQFVNLYNVFGDDISGPFYEYDKVGDDADGNALYKKYIGFTMRTEEHDENHKITTEYLQSLCNDLLEELTQYGFVYDPANSDMTGGTTGYGTRYYCLISEEAGLQIKLESNGTRNFWLYIYNLGDYQKKA